MNAFDFIKKHKGIIYWGLVFLVVIIPFNIWFAYQIGQHGCVVWETSVTEGEALTFYAAILTFLGTVLFSYLAYEQNKNANAINERQHELEKSKIRADTQPTILVVDWHAFEENEEKIIFEKPNELFIQIGDCDTMVSCLKFKLFNPSNTFVAVKYKTATIVKNNEPIGKWKNAISNRQNIKLYVDCGKHAYITFYCSSKLMSSYTQSKIEIKFILENSFGDKYQETVNLYMYSYQKIGENWSVTLSPQEYSLKKYTRNKDGEVVLCDQELMNPFPEI